jgi:hypothetical protein
VPACGMAYQVDDMAQDAGDGTERDPDRRRDETETEREMRSVFFAWVFSFSKRGKGCFRSKSHSHAARVITRSPQRPCGPGGRLRERLHVRAPNWGLQPCLCGTVCRYHRLKTFPDSGRLHVALIPRTVRDPSTASLRSHRPACLSQTASQGSPDDSGHLTRNSRSLPRPHR